METTPNLFAIAITLPFIGLFAYVTYQFGCFIYHWYKVVTNVSNKFYQVPGSLLLSNPKNFNETGQAHLIKFRHRKRKLIYSAISLFLVMVTVSLIKNNVS